MSYFIEAVDHASQPKMLDFLKRHENTTLFLLGNAVNYGIKLSDSPYSGNFKFIRSSSEIVGVFCLTKKGNLLIESTIRKPVFDLVLAACQEEPIPLAGVVGNWDFCNAFWQFLKDKQLIQKETFASQEILYNIHLSATLPTRPEVRFLIESDYSQWKPLRLDYLKEEGVPNDLSDDQLLRVFLDKVEHKIIWGFFIEDKLVSIADLNAKALDLGQVGGVYTVPQYRQKGYSKSVMQQLLSDAKNLHAIRKLMIFTGMNNLPAQRLYESLGVQRVGYFALLFGQPCTSNSQNFNT